MERLRDDESEWGLTRLEYSRREALRLKAREKARRDRARHRERLHGRFVASPPKPAPIIGDVWALASIEGRELGIIAVTGERPHRFKAYISTTRDWQATDAAISLPYVSIQHRSSP